MRHVDHYQIASQLLAAGRFVDAVAEYSKAVSLKPDYAEAYNGLGLAFRALRLFDQALDAYNHALDANPDYAHAFSGRGSVFRSLGRSREAILDYISAIRLKPDYPSACHNLGTVLEDLGQFENALASYEHALLLSPEFTDAHESRGRVLFKTRQLQDALQSFETALRLQPDRAESHFGRGLTLYELRRLPEALASYDRAIQMRPDLAEAYNNRGLLLRELGLPNDALISYDQALTYHPGLRDAIFNKALCQLSLGDFESGFLNYEARLDNDEERSDVNILKQIISANIGLLGKTVLLYSEQGYGDTIQFVRYSSLISERGARIILEVQQPLQRLLSQLPGVASVISAGTARPPHDFRCSLMSLAFVFNTQPTSVPCSIPYISAGEPDLALWQARTDFGNAARVGLVWAGGSRIGDRAAELVEQRRSIPLDDLIALTSVPNVAFISLQIGRPAKEMQQATSSAIHNFESEIRDFADTAALIACLDLVIAVDTAVAHLAGAMGRPIWLLNRHDTDWRWGYDSGDSAWYPTLRQFRQRTRGDWMSVIADVESELRRYVTDWVRTKP